MEEIYEGFSCFLTNQIFFKKFFQNFNLKLNLILNFSKEDFQLCIFGLITNGGLIYATWKSKTLKNPYGLLCAFIGGLNCCFLTALTAFTIIPIM